MPADSRLTKLGFMSNTEFGVTIIMDEKLGANVNIN